MPGTGDSDRPSRTWQHVGADPRLGRLPVLMLALTVVSGVVDAASILGLGHVFVANMTGNIVFLGLGVVGAPGFDIVRNLIVLAAFAAGAVLGGYLAQRVGRHKPSVARDAAAVTALGLLVCLVLLLTLDLAGEGELRVVSAIAAASLGVQFAGARTVAVPDMTTSVVTGTLSGLAAEHVHAAPGAASRRALVLVALLLGAAVGGLLMLAVGGVRGTAAAVGLAVVLLAGVSVTAGIDVRRERASAA
ncbi:hypothetical protein GCM10009836_11490 [Pseudonocardia ailaonensis]|uniref:DUF1275 domain-containing protein n=1 Tax=Pseudonocardia ailaonensis TaxID=367279 RepID=A0ABN2MR73_9PSEU